MNSNKENPLLVINEEDPFFALDTSKNQSSNNGMIKKNQDSSVEKYDFDNI